MPDQDKLEHNHCGIYIYKHICVQYLKVFCVLVNDTYCFHGWEDIYNIWEAAKMTGKYHVSQGVTSHQCGEWRMFVSIEFESPPLVIESRSPAWQAGILATILWRIQICWFAELSSKCIIIHSTIQLHSAIATSRHCVTAEESYIYVYLLCTDQVKYSTPRVV